MTSELPINERDVQYAGFDETLASMKPYFTVYSVECSSEIIVLGEYNEYTDTSVTVKSFYLDRFSLKTAFMARFQVTGVFEETAETPLKPDTTATGPTIAVGSEWIYTSEEDESLVELDLPPGLLELTIKTYLSEYPEVTLAELKIPVIDSGISYDVEIESSNGTVFRVGQDTTTVLRARVFRNGAEVTDDLPESAFRWTRTSLIPREPPYDDALWNTLYSSGYKQIEVNVDDVYARAVFKCEIVF